MSLAEFGVKRPVVANLVMFALLVAGFVFGVSLTREFFPEVRPNRVTVSAPYPGAAPDEVEQALAIKIEDRLVDLSDVEEIETTVSEGGATLVVEYREGVPIEDAIAEVKREIDSLQDLPDAADRIVVGKLEPNLPAIVVSIFGDGSEIEMKRAARALRDDLRSLPGMGQITTSGTRGEEIAVEVRPGMLIKHGLSMPDVARRVTEAMLELPGGSVRTGTSNYQLRAVGVDERAETVRGIVIKFAEAGAPVLLGDIADVRDTFKDVPIINRLDGKPAVNLTVMKEGDEDIVQIAEMVKAYVAGRNGEPFEPGAADRIGGLLGGLRPPTPAGEGENEVGPGDTATATPPVPTSNRHRAWLLGQSRMNEALPGELVTTTDLARFVTQRLDLLTRNALAGGLLVFVTLVVLLNWRISFWVAAGLIVSLMGTLVMMRFTGITLNLLSMFGLIVVIGILVDDAIVVAENIAARHEAGEPALAAAVTGTRQVGWPVVATVMTTVCAFLPLALIGGTFGDIMAAIPYVVACALLVSLIECLFILPSHMGHSLKHTDEARKRHREGLLSRLDHRLDRTRDYFFKRLVTPAYLWLLTKCLRFRYVSLALALAVMIGSLGMVTGGHLPFIFLEEDDAETVQISLEMPIGTPISVTDAMIRRVEEAVDVEVEAGFVTSYYTSVGSSGSIDGEEIDVQAAHIAQMILELAPVETRDGPDGRPSPEIINDIRARVGELPGIRRLRFEGISGGPVGTAFNYTLVGDDEARLETVAREVIAELESYAGVVDVSTDSDKGLQELRFELRPGATEMGFTRESLGRQIQAFAFGIEAFTFAGDREDVDVRVMLPEADRRSLAAIERQFVFTPDGRPVPLAEVAEITPAEGYATIRRFGERQRPQRAITVLGDVDGANPEQVARSMAPFFAELERRNPDVRLVERGRQKDLADAMSSLPLGMAAAAGMIYVILAWLFGSYTQPLVVMAGIPFATIGMIWGHVLLGYNMTFLSIVGFVALSGIVVNDSLIFMEFFNEERRSGKSVYDAAVAAGRARVRAILLTTITTVLGLTPLMLERSFQAQFLIPMAITISFGLISATAIILLVLPALLMIKRDITLAARGLWRGEFSADDRYVDPAEEAEAAMRTLREGGGVPDR